MKKISTIVSLVALTATSTFAQRVFSGEASGYARANTFNFDKADTSIVVSPGVANPSGGGCDTLTVYSIPNNGGFISGVNAYGDLEKAALFGGSGNVIAVFAVVAGSIASPGFENAAFGAKVYNVDVNTATFTEVGSSPALPIPAMDDSTGAPTVWPITTGGTVSGNFAVSIEVGKYTPSTVDAGIILFQTRDNCGNGDLFWEKWEDGDWYPVNHADSWDMEAEIAIGAAITGFSSNPDVELVTGVTLFPNPVENQFNLTYTNKVSGNVRVDIIDAAGRTVKVINEGAKAAGTYMTTVDTQEFGAGLYTYRITVAGKQAQGKFIVK